MFSRLGKLEVRCDAPAYSVVEACENLGFQSPLDVRWLRLGRFLKEQGQTPWQWIFGRSQDKEITCPCGQPMPKFDHYTFTFITNKMIDYLLGQCPRCRTMFWEEG
jgi:hypothetical protein